MRQGGQHEMSLDHRELISDALARAGTERQVHELRTSRASLGREPPGIERVGFLPVGSMPVHHERDDEDEPPARQVIAANLV